MSQSQEFSITYAGVTLGGASANYTLQGPYSFEQSYQTGSVSANVLVANTTQYANAAAFAAACDALEDAFRTPRGALVVSLGASTLISASHTSNTGLNTEASIVKVGGDEDTGRSRLYRITVRYGLPADLSGQNGRQSSTVDVDYDASRIRTVTISGVYTALASNGARAQYDAAAATYFAAVKSALSITTWETVDEDVATDDADKYATFRMVKREIVYNQSSAGADHDNIVSHTVAFSKDVSAPGDSGNGTVQRLENYTCTYECSVRDTADLEGLYEGTIRPYLLSEFQSRFSREATIVDERPSYEAANRKISATLSIQAKSGAQVVESVTTMSLDDDLGLAHTGAWDGNPHSYYVDQAKAVRIMTQRRREVFVGIIPPVHHSDRALDSRFPGPFGNLGKGYRIVSASSASTPVWIGQVGGQQIILSVLEDVCILRYAEKPKEGGGATTTPSNPPNQSGGQGGGGTVTVGGDKPPTQTGAGNPAVGSGGTGTGTGGSGGSAPPAGGGGGFIDQWNNDPMTPPTFHPG